MFSFRLCYTCSGMQKITKIGCKDSLIQPSFGWKCFGLYNKDREFCTFKNKYVHDFIRKSIKGGRICALNRYFKSKQIGEIMLTIKKHLKIGDDEISPLIDEYLKYITIKEKEYEKLFIGEETDYRKIDKKGIEDFDIEKFSELEVSIALPMINEDDFLVSYAFNNLYPSAESDGSST